MIRVRDKQGKIIDNLEIGFVEVCDLDGNLFSVIYENAQNGIQQLNGSCSESTRYAKLFKSKFNRKIINLQD